MRPAKRVLLDTVRDVHQLQKRSVAAVIPRARTQLELTLLTVVEAQSELIEQLLKLAEIEG